VPKRCKQKPSNVQKSRGRGAAYQDRCQWHRRKLRQRPCCDLVICVVGGEDECPETKFWANFTEAQRSAVRGKRPCVRAWQGLRFNILAEPFTSPPKAHLTPGLCIQKQFSSGIQVATNLRRPLPGVASVLWLPFSP
jgi:hypothetical protein